MQEGELLSDVVNVEEFEVWEDAEMVESDQQTGSYAANISYSCDAHANARLALGDVSLQFHEYYQKVLDEELLKSPDKSHSNSRLQSPTQSSPGPSRFCHSSGSNAVGGITPKKRSTSLPDCLQQPPAFASLSSSPHGTTRIPTGAQRCASGLPPRAPSYTANTSPFKHAPALHTHPTSPFMQKLPSHMADSHLAPHADNLLPMETAPCLPLVANRHSFSQSVPASPFQHLENQGSREFQQHFSHPSNMAGPSGLRQQPSTMADMQHEAFMTLLSEETASLGLDGGTRRPGLEKGSARRGLFVTEADIASGARFLPR